MAEGSSQAGSTWGQALWSVQEEVCMHLTTPPCCPLCHTAARIPLGVTISSSCLPEGFSGHGHHLCGGTMGGSYLGRMALVLVVGGCRGVSTLQHRPPTLCAPASPALLGCG